MIFNTYIMFLVVRQHFLHNFCKKTHVSAGVLRDGVSEVRVVFGHIVQVDGETYLLPVGDLHLRHNSYMYMLYKGKNY